ncbi:MAG: DUF4363 family protein [Oscillospiraceae bacterium]|nr:DUF4363 family protein [Oscillospiraceae bacterium]
MKRFIIGLVTLTLLFSVGLFVSTATDKAYEPVVTLLEQAADTALSGSFEDAVLQAQKAKELWEKHKEKTATVADHTPMEEIDQLFTEVEIYAMAEEKPHFAACCAQLASAVQNMADAHALNFWNLL